MKRILATAILFAVTSVASAVDLDITNIVATGLVPSSANGGFNPTPGISGFTATNGTIGTLEIDGPGHVTFTYLGKEAGYSNFFLNVGGVPVSLINDISANVGVTSTQTYLAAGVLSFSFGENSSTNVTNGFATNGSPTFAIFAGQSSGYKYILGYDDSGAGPDRDFDDMVIGVNVTPIPEPETYAMLAAGLGLMGFVARRRRQTGAAA